MFSDQSSDPAVQIKTSPSENDYQHDSSPVSKKSLRCSTVTRNEEICDLKTHLKVHEDPDDGLSENSGAFPASENVDNLKSHLRLNQYVACGNCKESGASPVGEDAANLEDHLKSNQYLYVGLTEDDSGVPASADVANLGLDDGYGEDSGVYPVSEDVTSLKSCLGLRHCPGGGYENGEESRASLSGEDAATLTDHLRSNHPYVGSNGDDSGVSPASEDVTIREGHLRLNQYPDDGYRNAEDSGSSPTGRGTINLEGHLGLNRYPPCVGYGNNDESGVSVACDDVANLKGYLGLEQCPDVGLGNGKDSEASLTGEEAAKLEGHLRLNQYPDVGYGNDEDNGVSPPSEDVTNPKSHLRLNPYPDVGYGNGEESGVIANLKSNLGLKQCPYHRYGYGEDSEASLAGDDAASLDGHLRLNQYPYVGSNLEDSGVSSASEDVATLKSHLRSNHYPDVAENSGTPPAWEDIANLKTHMKLQEYQNDNGNEKDDGISPASEDVVNLKSHLRIIQYPDGIDDNGRTSRESATERVSENSQNQCRKKHEQSVSDISDDSYSTDSSSTDSDLRLSPLLIYTVEMKEAVVVGDDSVVSSGEMELSVGFGATMQMLPDSSPDETEVKCSLLSTSASFNFSFDGSDVIRAKLVESKARDDDKLASIYFENSSDERSPALSNSQTQKQDHASITSVCTSVKEDDKNGLFSPDDDDVEMDGVARLNLRLFDSDALQEEFIRGLMETGTTSSPYATEKGVEKGSETTAKGTPEIKKNEWPAEEVPSKDTNGSSKLYQLLDLRNQEGPIVWCKPSASGSDSTLIITDHHGNILEMTSNSSSRLECGSAGASYTLYISESIDV